MGPPAPIPAHLVPPQLLNRSLWAVCRGVAFNQRLQGGRWLLKSFLRPCVYPEKKVSNLALPASPYDKERQKAALGLGALGQQ